MKNWQYDLLAERFDPKGPPIYITPMTGRHKGQVFVVALMQSRCVSVADPSGQVDFIDYTYSIVEECDKDGTPVIRPNLDMTGRPLTIDCYVAFTKNRTPMLFLGRVKSFTAIGDVLVQPIAYNGAKVEDSNKTYEVDPFATIRVPVDEKDVIFWKLQGFEALGAEKRKGLDWS